MYVAVRARALAEEQAHLRLGPFICLCDILKCEEELGVGEAE